uniref:BPI2 domain-containing protein n=1 Tax=Strongyloides venezuelensis TaxID=75913 RepID=A0A0K0F1N4_STRVS
MAGVAIDYINSAIAEVNMPDIEGLLKFTYHLSQIKIEEFNIPKSSNAFQFSSLDKLGINLQGILGKMSTYYQVKIKEGFLHLNNALTSNPESSTTSFTISIEGLIYYEGHLNDPKIPKPDDVIHPYNTNKYLCIDFDSDRVLDSAAYAFELSKLSHFMIDDNILKLF